MRRVLRKILGLVNLVALFYCITGPAFAQSFPGANPNSSHQLDFCNIKAYTDNGTSIGQTISPVTNLADALTQSCTNEVAGNRYFQWTTACTPILTPGDYSDAGFQPQSGGWFEPFTGSGTRIRKDDGAIAQYVNLGSCGCTVSGPVSGYVGVGSDGTCYCAAGYDWDDAAHACLPPKYYLNVASPTAMQCGATNNCVGEPINPTTGAVFDTITDASSTSGSLPFKRFYNSTDAGSAELSGGWRHSYSRSVEAKYTIIEPQHYLQSATTSSLYDTPSEACQSGFSEIQSQVPNWSGVTALYSSGNCQLTKNGVSIGSVTVYSSATFAPSPASTPVAYDVIRDDGQLIRFTSQNGTITAPPTVNLKLQQTSSGYTLTDASDTVETYDTNGKLLSITSRGGTVQTTSYDTSGRLSGVTDNFGRQLILSYDSQSRLITVTRQ